MVGKYELLLSAGVTVYKRLAVSSIANEHEETHRSSPAKTPFPSPFTPRSPPTTTRTETLRNSLDLHAWECYTSLAPHLHLLFGYVAPHLIAPQSHIGALTFSEVNLR